MVLSPKVLDRMRQNLVWNTFLIDPLCVANCKEIGRGKRSCQFHVDLVWNDPLYMYQYTSYSTVQFKLDIYTCVTLELFNKFVESLTRYTRKCMIQYHNLIMSDTLVKCTTR